MLCFLNQLSRDKNAEGEMKDGDEREAGKGVREVNQRDLNEQIRDSGCDDENEWENGHVNQEHPHFIAVSAVPVAMVEHEIKNACLKQGERAGEQQRLSKKTRVPPNSPAASTTMTRNRTDAQTSCTRSRTEMNLMII